MLSTINLLDKNKLKNCFFCLTESTNDYVVLIVFFVHLKCVCFLLNSWSKIKKCRACSNILNNILKFKNLIIIS